MTPEQAQHEAERIMDAVTLVGDGMLRADQTIDLSVTASNARYEMTLEAQLEAALRKYRLLADAVNDYEGPCLPTCDSIAHAEDCPRVSNAVTLEMQQARIAELEESVRHREALYQNEKDDADSFMQESREQRERIAALEAELAAAKAECERLREKLGEAKKTFDEIAQGADNAL